MAITLPAKAPGELLDYAWVVPVNPEDNVSSFTATVTTGTVTIADSEIVDGSIALAFSGGADGETALITLTATSEGSLTYNETLYLPVEARTNRKADTARDVCNFALRRIVGLGVEPDADEMADALERLNDMLLHWRDIGADAGANLPLELNDVLYVPDQYLRAIKNALLVETAEFYGDTPSVIAQRAAQSGLALIRSNNLTDPRPATEYF